MPGVRVAGNDVLAVHQGVDRGGRSGARRRRATMIEARHLSPRRSLELGRPLVDRDPSEPETWNRGPAHRLRAYLKHKGLYSPDHEKQTVARYNEAITAALARADEAGMPPLESLFDDVYEELPWHLAEQRDYLLAQPRSKSPHKH